jgi:hypothetical protein
MFWNILKGNYGAEKKRSAGPLVISGQIEIVDLNECGSTNG